MTDFWNDKEQLAAALREHGSYAAISRATGVAASTLKDAGRRLGLPKRPSSVATPRVVASEAADDSWLLSLLKQHGDSATVESLADEADCSPRKVREALARLGEAGFRVSEDSHEVVLDRVPPARENVHKLLFAGERVRLGVVSDTHLGSREERLDELHTACALLEEEGIDTILHPGDLVAGLGIYRGQVRDVHKHTFEEQRIYAAENLPRGNYRWKIIAGNHDLDGEAARSGYDPVRAVANVRDDVDYLGEFDAWIELPNGGWIHMLHPGGGASYALSYKPQKLCEGYEAGRKPNLLLLGHYHRRGNFRHREIEALLCGTFEGSTNLAKRYGMGQPAVGAHILDFVMADDGSLVRFKIEWLPFFYGRSVKAA